MQKAPETPILLDQEFIKTLYAIGVSEINVDDIHSSTPTVTLKLGEQLRDVGTLVQENPEAWREVPQEVSGTEYARAEPHAAERALWKAQREAGTDEIWLEQASDNNGCWWEVDNDFEPEWIPKHKYRVKPMKLTAKIVPNIKVPPGTQEWPACNWEFYGTREEYRAECEKYGYVVLSEITEVVEKPEKVKYYFALAALEKQKDSELRLISLWNSNKKNLITSLVGCTIIGDIEEREVEV